MGFFRNKPQLDSIADLTHASYNTNSLNTTTYTYLQVIREQRNATISGAYFLTSDVTGSPTALVELYVCDDYLLPTGDVILSKSISAVNQTSRTITFDSTYVLQKDTFYCFKVTNASADPTTSYFKMSYTSCPNGLWTYSTDGTNYVWMQYGNFVYPILDQDYDAYTLAAYLNDGGSGSALYNVDSSRLAYVANKYSFVNPCFLHCVEATVSKTGSPNYALVCEVLDADNTSIAISVPVYLNNTTGVNQFVFSTPVQLASNTAYYVAFRAETLGTVGDGSNYFRINKSDKRYGILPAEVIGAYYSTAWASRSWSVFTVGAFLGINLWGDSMPSERVLLIRP